MTPLRFWIASALFHALAISGACVFARRWSDPTRCAENLGTWSARIVRDGWLLAVWTYLASLAATLAANIGYERSRVVVGEISLRLLGQGIFVEGVLVCMVLAAQHRRAQRLLRAAALGTLAFAVLAANVNAYFIEPGQVKVRHHTVARRGDATTTLRILHLSDIQTPAIGTHEEEALSAGLRHAPDLIVLTGDYVQDALGRPTELDAAADLRSLIKRLAFTARLGVFATDGDVGPPCRVVFAGTGVNCLVDESLRVALPDGRTLGITGLSRGRGRERNPARLARILSAASSADHRIVISHAPDFVDAMPIDVDLVLAGHTHGGQVVIPWFGPPTTASRLPRRYAGGLNDFNGTPLHVSRGIGMERGFAIPVRFLCPPEICLVDLPLAKVRYSVRNESKQ